MVVRTGERAQETGDFHCVHCGTTVHVIKGDKIPPCPCGTNEFDLHAGEPGHR